MRQPLFRFLLCLLTLLSFRPQLTKANHAAGGQLTYEWISDSTYRIYFKFSRDCTGDSAPATVAVCLHNTCTNTTISTTMTKMSQIGSGPGYGCPQYKTKCDSPTSMINGAIEWMYSAIVTLPSCNLWRFYVYGGHRSSTDNLQNATNTVLYLESTFNNAQFQGNSSPYYALISYINTCVNSQLSYHAGAVDPNGDSLVYEIVNPMTGAANCGAGLVNVPFANPTLNLVNNPLPCNNSFVFNPAGSYSFIPSQTGLYSLLFRVKEYRSSIFVGSTMSEVRLQVLPCPSLMVDFKVDTNNISGGMHLNDTIIGCPGQPLSFCWWTKAFDTTTYLKVQDNHVQSMPGATIVYTMAPQKRDSIRGCLTWTPQQGDTALKSLTITAIDSGCQLGKPVMQLYYPFNIRYRIHPPTRIFKDTSICPNGAANLRTNVEGNYTWSVVSGAPSSLSCTSCSNPIATPSITSQYEVVTTANAYCNHNRDTVTVTVLPNTNPSIKVTVTPDSNLIKGQSQVFYATVTNCNNPTYQWVLNGNNVPGATINQWSSPPRSDQDNIFCKLSCKDICPNPVDTFSNTITMHITDTTNSIGIMRGNYVIKLYPNPNNGNFIISELKNWNGTIHILNSVGQTVYKGKLTGKDQMQIEVSGLANGIYFIKLRTNEDILATRFVVQQ